MNQLAAATLLGVAIAGLAPATATAAEGPSSPDATTAAQAGNCNCPVPIHTVRPVYPIEAGMDGAQANVRVCFTVTADGTVADARVKSVKRPQLSHPPLSEYGDLPRQFSEASLIAIRRWRFRPASVHGQPVATHDVCQPLRFRLR